MRDLMMKVWHSPTLMTWGSFLSRSIGLLLVLPIAVQRLEEGEIVVWYLFTSIFSLQWILDLGFGSTASRAVAYAASGARRFGPVSSSQSHTDSSVNWDFVGRIRSIMHLVYAALGIASFVLLALFGTWALLKPMANLYNEQGVWTAWVLILLVYPLTMYGNQYWAYLEGMNKVALVRRWDMFVGIASGLSMALALQLGGGLLGLVICNQLLAIFRVTVYWRLTLSDRHQFALHSKARSIDRELLGDLWAGAWRSGIGGIMSYGLSYAASFLIANFQSATVAASYLISARLLDALLQVSQAPFYSKLPVLTKLRATGQLEKLISTSRDAMRKGYWCFVAGFLVLAVFAEQLLAIIHSNARFASSQLWSLMGLAMFSHFYGAMHIQLYSTTNHIIWHVANTISGAIFVLIAYMFIGQVGIYAIPLGWLCGYAGFYAWYSAGHSYKSLKVQFWRFESTLMLPPLLVMALYSLYALTENYSFR